MIINSLTLHNFMSYADAQLDLSSVELVCLTGPNGAGKSALLDAITWALWESARATSDELVRLGQEEMRVELRFSLEGQEYRLRRSRQKTFARSGQQTGSRGNLDLQVWSAEKTDEQDAAGSHTLPSAAGSRQDGSRTGQSDNEIAAESAAGEKSVSASREKRSSVQLVEAQSHDMERQSASSESQAGKWKSLNGSSMRDTQKRLRELLRMDYETFITSVYLRQGKADEFTTRSPNERKQVLADILGLDYFERLQEACRQEARECKGRIQVLESNLTSSGVFEADFNKYCSDIATVRTELEELFASLENKTAGQRELEAEIAELKNLAVRRDSAGIRVLELQNDISGMERRIAEMELRRKKLSSILAGAEDIAEQSRQFAECKSLAESMDIQAGKFSELSSQRSELRSAMAMIQGRMEVEIEHLKATIQGRQKKRDELQKSCRDAKKLEDQFSEYRRLLDAELEMSRKRESFSALSSRAEELQALIGEARVRLEAQIQQKEQLLDELDDLLRSKSLIENEETILISELDAIEHVEAEFELVEEKGIKVKSQIDIMQQQIAQLKKYIRESEEKMHELCRTPDLSSCPLCRAPIVDSKSVLDRYRQDCESAASESSSLENCINTLAEERDRLRARYVELRKKLSERKAIDMKIGEFNARKSAIERAQTTRDSLSAELQEAKNLLQQNLFAPVEKESLVRIKAELNKLEFDPIVFSSFQAQMRAQRHVELRYQQLKRDLQEMSDLDREIPLLQERCKEMEADLLCERFAPEEKAKLKEIDDSISALNYNKFAHQEAKRNLAELFPYAEKARDLENAEQELPGLNQSCADLQIMIAERRQESTRIADEEKKRTEQLEALPVLQSNLELRRSEILQLESRKEDLQKQQVVLETRLQQLSEGKKDLDNKRKVLADNLKEMGEYNLLSEAFGKKGLQAIIIENAIPEIEAEANRLLARLTDNRMHLSLLTQQRNRQGNAMETLDIIIADEIGTRSYELYSGGEAFKINFALRVAMSQLLARRAGARLETLIIDEGFGSQDEHSRAKIIQAISAVKADFARIIIVTHINEIKEMFPMQISISKEDGVSKISLAS